jgi:transposase InsO family protein
MSTLQQINKPTVATDIARANSLLRRAERHGVHAVAEQEGMHPATLWRMKARKSAGEPLYDRRRMNPGAASSVDDTRKGWALAFMAARQQVKMSVVCRELNKVALREGWPETDYQALKRAIRALPADVRTLLAEGSRSMFEKTSLVGRRDQSRPLELVQMDASEIAVYTVHPATGKLIVPWMTGVVDAYSRVVLDLRFHLEAPDAIESVAALASAFLPKEDETHPFFGLAETVQTDNAKVYTGTVMSAVSVRAGFVLDPVPVNSPSANGKIERFFGTFKARFASKLEGYTRQSHGMSKAKRYGIIPWEVLKSLGRRFLLEYHGSAHSELGVTPWEAWHEGIDRSSGYFVPAAEIREKMRVEIRAKVSREGVTVLGGNYSGPCLVGLVDEEVVVLASAFGGDQSVDAYHRGRFIGKLRPRELVADEINTNRVARKMSLQKFRARMRESLEATPPADGISSIRPADERRRIREKAPAKPKKAVRTVKLHVEGGSK